MSEFSKVARTLYGAMKERYKDNPDPHLAVRVALRTPGVMQGIVNSILTEVDIEAETYRLIRKN